MTLLQRIAAMWQRLAPAGWGTLLAAHGLTIKSDVDPSTLPKLLKQKLKVNRSLLGFDEFPAQGSVAIEPGQPALSLLYFALASPRVRVAPDGTALAAFPTLAELEAVENYIYSAREWSLDEVRKSAAEIAGTTSPALAIVVYATEFRNAPDTVLQTHADFCFSRTGIARTGLAAPYYEPAERGFVYRTDADDPFTIRVAPVRYTAWIAVAVSGNHDQKLPMDFNSMQKYALEFKSVLAPDLYAKIFAPQLGDDAQRQFWVPVHKLFNGDECLRQDGAPWRLTLRLNARHVNEKLAKLFGYLQSTLSPERLKAPPFRETSGLAEWSTADDHGAGVLAPVPHPNLVEPAVLDGEFLTVPVPPATSPRELVALKTPLIGGPRVEYRTVPGYVHIRHEIRDGQFEDLNAKFPNPLDLIQYVSNGNYHSLGYRDFTADGWIEASVPELAEVIPQRKPAYSIVSPPDFFPRVDQRRLIELQGEIITAWFAPPVSLSDNRAPANVELEGAGFDPTDTTLTAIISLPNSNFGKDAVQRDDSHSSPRHTGLPDDGAGVFHPGWDVGLTYNGVFEYLTNFTLGAPFPEDVKLCAAISAYWPGVVPDAARVLVPIAPDPKSGQLRVQPVLPTVIPMTDREIGMDEDIPAWDGWTPPKLIDDPKQMSVEYISPLHADYVANALVNRFSLAETSKMDFAHYRGRILAMQAVYTALGIKPVQPTSSGQDDPRAHWLVYSFREAEQVELTAAKVKKADAGLAFCIWIFEHDVVQPVPAQPMRFRVAVKGNEMLKFVAIETKGSWKAVAIK